MDLLTSKQALRPFSIDEQLNPDLV